MIRLTFDEGDECGDIYHSVTVESTNEATIERALDLVIQVLLGAGFQPTSVERGLRYALAEHYEPES